MIRNMVHAWAWESQAKGLTSANRAVAIFL